MEWKKYHCYRVFDEFIETFILGKHSYITNHPHQLDLRAGLSEIKTLFVDNFDRTGKNYESKLKKQFSGVSTDIKIIFSNIEYLWCMPVDNISPDTKQNYLKRWFKESEIKQGERFFFEKNHAAANAGQWNNQNKFYEICCIIRLITRLFDDDNIRDLPTAKQALERMCYEAIYIPGTMNDEFNIKNSCASHNMILHLSNPDAYEVIVSNSDKEKILDVFGDVLNGDYSGDRESRIKRIKNKLYNQYSLDFDFKDPDFK